MAVSPATNQIFPTMVQLARQLADLLAPVRCVLCRQYSHNPLAICPCCQGDLCLFNYHLFDDLLLQPNIKAGLSQIGFDRLLCLAPYQWPFNQWIVDLKFAENFAIAHLLSKLFCQTVSPLLAANPALTPDLILPMPIHRRRQFSRGYNQSLLLAKVIGQQLGITVDQRLLVRDKATQAQSRLNRQQRQHNIKGAFSYLGKPLRHVVVLDDVVTTGATINEVCLVLKKAGIETVSVWSICATPTGKKVTSIPAAGDGQRT